MGDIIGNDRQSDDNRWDFSQCLSQKGIVYLIQECVNAFFMYSQKNPMCCSDDSFETEAVGNYSKRKNGFDWEMCKNNRISFAKIVDYKSSFFLQAGIL